MFRVNLSIVGRTQLVALIAALLMGCATAYQPKSFSGGYSETQLAENVFQVSFSGNGYTSSERTSDFSLLRAAALTLENNFRYFIIVESGKESKLYTYTTPSTSHTNWSANSYGNYTSGNATTTTYGGQTYLISKPGSTNTIVCFKEKPKVDGLVFDAQFISKSISAKYGIR